jgi:hypothetical protein
MAENDFSSRPNLKKESVVFEAVNSIGWGAVLGSGVSLAVSAVQKLRKKPITSKNAMNQFLVWGALAGIGAAAGRLITTESKNDQKEAVRPYVERLEAELAAKSVAPDDSIQK